MRKELARGGNRRPIIESDDEEEQKKVRPPPPLLQNFRMIWSSKLRTISMLSSKFKRRQLSAPLKPRLSLASFLTSAFHSINKKPMEARPEERAR